MVTYTGLEGKLADVKEGDIVRLKRKVSRTNVAGYVTGFSERTITLSLEREADSQNTKTYNLSDFDEYYIALRHVEFHEVYR